MRTVFNELTGREVRLPNEVQRIVSFSPSVTETLFLLGLGERVVGVSPFCVRPAEAREVEKVGSYNTTRPERLRALEPDVIFTVTGYQRAFALDLAKAFPVYPLELPVSVWGILDTVVKVGLVGGAVEEARDLAAQLLATLSSLPATGEGTAYVEIDFGEPVTFGAYSYITDGLRLLGLRSLFGEEPREWLTPRLDEVPAADPDVLLYEAKMFASFGQEDFEDLLEGRGWRELRAVREGQALLMPRPHDFLAHHGPSFVLEALPWLAERLGLQSRT